MFLMLFNVKEVTNSRQWVLLNVKHSVSSTGFLLVVLIMNTMYASKDTYYRKIISSFAPNECLSYWLFKKTKCKQTIKASNSYHHYVTFEFFFSMDVCWVRVWMDCCWQGCSNGLETFSCCLRLFSIWLRLGHWTCQILK